MNSIKIVMYNTEGTGTHIEKDVLRDKKIENVDLVRIDGDQDEVFFKEASDADGLIVVYVDMNRERILGLKNCKIIAAQAIGVNNIDLTTATENGICVSNVPDYCIDEVAAHTLGLVLNCSRKITQLDRSVKSGNWDVMAAGKMYRMTGKTYGLVSFGNISRRVAEVLKPFNMKVIAFDPFVSDEIFEKNGVERIFDLHDLFAQSDYISVHTPLTAETKHMIGKEQFDKVKEGAVIISVGRGGIINETDLKEAIQTGRVEAAGIDVIEDEIQHKSVLTGMEEVVATPHSAYYSEDSLNEVRGKAIEQVIDVLIDNNLPKHLVNKNVVLK